MGEIDTKPIESVQAALSLFGEKGDQRKYRSTGSEAESDKEEFEGLQKELASCKLQLEAKQSAYMQVLLKLQQYEERVDELSTLLMKSQLERDHFIEECREAQNCVDELLSKTKEMADELSELAKVREQLIHALNELKASQGELLGLGTELAAERDMKLKALTQAEALETAATVEKDKVEELFKQLEELSQNTNVLKIAAAEAEKEKGAELENMKNQIAELENQLYEKYGVVESLQMDFMQASELLSLAEKAASDRMADLEMLKAELEAKDRSNSEQGVHIEMLEMEVTRVKQELSNANESLSHLNCDVQMLTSDLQDARAELKDIKEREMEADVEIALLKAELHKARSKIIAAEAAGIRANSVKSGLYLAVQELAVEAGDAKKEYQRLKHETNNSTEFSFMVDPQTKSSSNGREHPEHEGIRNESEGESESESERKSEITIPLDVFNSLVSKQEVEILKKELEAAMMKVGEFRTRAEQAVSRAESAERAKALVEDQLRSWREQKQRRRAALAALKEESTPRVFNLPIYDRPTSTHPPLGKVLNMKF